MASEDIYSVSLVHLTVECNLGVFFSRIIILSAFPREILRSLFLSSRSVLPPPPRPEGALSSLLPCCEGGEFSVVEREEERKEGYATRVNESVHQLKKWKGICDP